MADLKNENPKAVEYFRNRGKEYFQLKEELKDFQMLEQDLGDLTVEQIRAIASMVRKKLSKGGIDAVEETIALYKRQAEIFRDALEDPKHTPIEDLAKIQYNLDKAETMLNLVNLFKNILIKLYANKGKADALAIDIPQKGEKILSAIANQNGKSIISSIDSFKTALARYAEAFGQYESANEAYSQATLESMPPLKHELISKELGEKLYIEMSKAIRDARQVQETNPAKAPSIERTIVSLEEGLQSLASILPKELVEKIKKDLEPNIAEAQKKQDEEKKKIQKDDYSARMEDAYSKIFVAVQEKYRTSDWSSTKVEKAIKEKNKLVFELFKEMPLEVKVGIDVEFAQKYDKRLKDTYGVELYNALVNVEDLIKDIGTINTLDPEDKTLTTKISTVMSRIDLIKNSEIVKKGILVVNQGENDVEFKFADERIQDRKVVLLKSELYERIHPKIQPGTTPGTGPEDDPKKKPGTTPGTGPEDDPKIQPGTTPGTGPEDDPKKKPGTTPGTGPEDDPKKKTGITPGTGPEDDPKKKPGITPGPGPEVDPKPTLDSSEEKDIQFYLNLLRETNAKVAEINRINQQLVFNNIFSEMSMANILHDVNVEIAAVAESAVVTKLRLELSDKRYDYLKKYGKYILSNPELKDVKIEEIRFETEFDEFLAKRDELIVDTELRIKELSEKKPEGYEEEIKHLLDFIKAQNSLIRRFLIAESVSRNIDVAAVLSERNERRKSILEEKLKGYTVAPEPKPGINPEPKPGIEPEPKPATDPGTAPEVEPETKQNPEPKPAMDPGTAPEVEPENKQNPEPKPGIEPESKPGIEPEPKPAMDPGTAPEVEPETKQESGFAPEPQGTDIPHVLVKETSLQFNPRNNRKVAKKINANDRLFTNMPRVTTTLIKNGVRIELSKQLRERLAELSAKISLVNKNNRRVRTSRMVDAEAESQDITFKKDHDVNFDDYTVEVRIPGESRSTVLLGDEEVQRRRR